MQYFEVINCKDTCVPLNLEKCSKVTAFGDTITHNLDLSDPTIWFFNAPYQT